MEISTVTNGNIPPEDEERLARWLQELEETIKLCGDVEWSPSDEERTSLVEVIRKSLSEEAASVPQWLTRHAGMLKDLFPVQEVLVDQLCSLSLPRLLLRYPALKEELNFTRGSDAMKEVEANENATVGDLAEVPLKTTETPPFPADWFAPHVVCRDGKSDQQKLATYFGSLGTPSDAMVNMCRLVDYSSRVAVVAEKDATVLARLTRVEEERATEAGAAVKTHADTLAALDTTDSSAPLAVATQQLAGEVNSVIDELNVAAAEEEEARLAYEKARRKTSALKQSAGQLEGMLGGLETQAAMMRRVTGIRMKLEEFSANAAERRKILLGALNRFVDLGEARVLRQRLSQDFPEMFSQLATVFRSMIVAAGGASANVPIGSLNAELVSNCPQRIPLGVAVRIGLETLSLARRLAGNAWPELSAQLESFSAELTALSEALEPVESIERLNKRKMLSANARPPATIVYFFNHVTHDTPPYHVENQARVDTSLRLLRSQPSGGTFTQRPLILENSNDILGPPRWVLPLVHSPAYLARLWKYSEEATSDDLYVPLEFETEWETDEEDHPVMAVKIEKKIKARKASVQRKPFLMPDLANHVGAETAQAVEQLLSAPADDVELDEALQAEDFSFSDTGICVPAASGVHNRHTSRALTTAVIRRRRTSETTSDPRRRVGKAVGTPYGTGVVLASLNSIDPSSPIVRVKLPWGIAFLNVDCIRPALPNVSNAPPRKSSKQQSAAVAAAAAAVAAASEAAALADPVAMAAAAAVVADADETRFQFTNLRLHSVFRRVLETIRIQRIALERVGVKDAHFSLWVHGRTSRGTTALIEEAVRVFLAGYSFSKLSQAIDVELEKPREERISGSDFLNYMDQHLAVVPHTPEAEQSEAELNYALRPAKAGEDPEYEELRQQAFVYSLGKLVKKSGEIRANPRRKPRQERGHHSGTGPLVTPRIKMELGADDEVEVSKPTPPKRKAPKRPPKTEPGTEGEALSAKRRRVSAALTKIPGFGESPDSDEPVVELSPQDVGVLRSLLRVLMTGVLAMSQTAFAADLTAKFGRPISQTIFSGWLRERLSAGQQNMMTQLVLRWLRYHASFLSPEDRVALTSIDPVYAAKIKSQDTSIAETTETAATITNDSATQLLLPISLDINTDVTTPPDVVSGEHTFDEDFERAELAAAAAAAGGAVSDDSGDESYGALLIPSINLPTESPHIVQQPFVETEIVSMSEEEFEPITEDFVQVEDSSPVTLTHPTNDFVDNHSAISSAINDTLEPHSLITEPVVPTAEVPDEKMQLQSDDDMNLDSHSLADDSGAESEASVAEASVAEASVAESSDEEEGANPTIAPTLDEDFVPVFGKVVYSISGGYYTIPASEVPGLDTAEMTMYSDRDIRALVARFNEETARRQLTHSYLAQEAARIGLNLTQPSISRFVRTSSVTASPVGLEYLRHLFCWLAYSYTKNTTPEPLLPTAETLSPEAKALMPMPTHGITPQSCSSCGVARAIISAKRDFLSHVATCNSERFIYRHAAAAMRQSRAVVAASQGRQVTSSRNTIPGFDPLAETEAITTMRTLLADGKVDVFVGDAPITIGVKEEVPVTIGSEDKMEITETTPTTISKCIICQNTDFSSGQINCSLCGSCTHPTCAINPSINFVCSNCVSQEIDQSVEVTAAERFARIVPGAVLLFLLPHGISSKPGCPCYVRGQVVALGRSPEDVHSDVILLRWQPPQPLPTDIDVSLRYAWVDVGVVACRIFKSRRTRKSTIDVFHQVPSHTESLPAKRVRRETDRLIESSLGVQLAPRPSKESASKSKTSNNSTTKILPPVAPGPTEEMLDTYVSASTLQAALCAAGSACRAVDMVLTSPQSNAFVCARPPGHHAGRNGCTRTCMSTGFCILNNAAIAATYARVGWGLKNVAVVDIDVHFGNGTAELLRDAPGMFFASVHMVYGERNDGSSLIPGNGCNDLTCGFYPPLLGTQEIGDQFISVGVQPSATPPPVKSDEVMDSEGGLPSPSDFIGAEGFMKALREVIIPRLEAFAPELLIISAGFDGFQTDPLGGEMQLTLNDYTTATKLLTAAMGRIAAARGDPSSAAVVSLLEGGYDTLPDSLGLARSVSAHVHALRELNP